MTLLEEPTLQDTTKTTPGFDRRSEVISWVEVCAVDALTLDRGVGALVGGDAVAIFRCRPDGAIYAIGNVDPFSGASVLSRGIVGSVGGRPVVASPVFKNRFDLRTGVSLEDPEIRVPVYITNEVGGQVFVQAAPVALSARDGGSPSVTSAA
jgi:nitrite reductase (NADH) small subunit